MRLANDVSIKMFSLQKKSIICVLDFFVAKAFYVHFLLRSPLLSSSVSGDSLMGSLRVESDDYEVEGRRIGAFLWFDMTGDAFIRKRGHGRSGRKGSSSSSASFSFPGHSRNRARDGRAAKEDDEGRGGLGRGVRGRGRSRGGGGGGQRRRGLDGRSRSSGRGSRGGVAAGRADRLQLH